MKEVFAIKNTETLKVLADPTRLAIIEACSDPTSATALADILEVPRTRLYHHLKLLESHGLINVPETRQVGPMTERLYQVVARRFEPSPELLTSGEQEERIDALLFTVLDATKGDMARAFDKGLISLDQTQQPRSLSVGRMTRRLAPEQVEEFVDRVTDLEQWFTEAVDSPDGHTFSFVHTFYRSR